MATVKISTEVERDAWEALEALAEASQMEIADLLGDAIREYVHRHGRRHEVLRHLDDSIRDNQELGTLLAR